MGLTTSTRDCGDGPQPFRDRPEEFRVGPQAVRAGELSRRRVRPQEGRPSESAPPGIERSGTDHKREETGRRVFWEVDLARRREDSPGRQLLGPERLGTEQKREGMGRRVSGRTVVTGAGEILPVHTSRDRVRVRGASGDRRPPLSQGVPGQPLSSPVSLFAGRGAGRDSPSCARWDRTIVHRGRSWRRSTTRRERSLRRGDPHRFALGPGLNRDQNRRLWCVRRY